VATDEVDPMQEVFLFGLLEFPYLVHPAGGLDLAVFGDPVVDVLERFHPLLLLSVLLEHVDYLLLEAALVVCNELLEELLALLQTLPTKVDVQHDFLRQPAGTHD